MREQRQIKGFAFIFWFLIQCSFSVTNTEERGIAGPTVGFWEDGGVGPSVNSGVSVPWPYLPRQLPWSQLGETSFPRFLPAPLDSDLGRLLPPLLGSKAHLVLGSPAKLHFCRREHAVFPSYTAHVSDIPGAHRASGAWAFHPYIVTKTWVFHL